MFQYTLRVRDLIHGTILFTKREEEVINHPLFQRLRQIRQNDVAFFVYPSLNTSRLEHVLGTCRVAGMMAEHLTRSPKWRTYLKELKTETGIASKEQFVELVRLYALLHDIGHLPLSHLFEMAAEEWSKDATGIIRAWTGVDGFHKLHEAFGAIIAEQIVSKVGLLEPTRRMLTRLMTEKTLPLGDPLSVIKSLIDSEIDADRTDFVQRDGLLAGGEYGHYDIRRLCDSVFIEHDERGWFIAYSDKALTSMEALFLDRYRTHIWIHFHHRVVAIKMLVRFLIGRALERGLIRKEQFNPADIERFALRDDVWLWSVLRDMEVDDEIARRIQRTIFYREKKNVLNLWKHRPEYHELREQVKLKARVTGIDYGFVGLYKNHLTERIGVDVLWFKVPFKPISEKAILLYSEDEQRLTGKNLLDVSRLITDLEDIWKSEPQEFILLVGENVAEKARELKRQWIELTASWVQK